MLDSDGDDAKRQTKEEVVQQAIKNGFIPVVIMSAGKIRKLEEVRQAFDEKEKERLEKLKRNKVKVFQLHKDKGLDSRAL